MDPAPVYSFTVLLAETVGIDRIKHGGKREVDMKELSWNESETVKFGGINLKLTMDPLILVV